MKKALRLLIIAAALTASQLGSSIPTHAMGTTNFGLGAIFGEPTGISAKYFLDGEHRMAIDAAMTYSFFEYFMGYGDFLYQFPGLFPKGDEQLQKIALYLGVGGGIRIASKDNPKAGDARANAFARFPFGAEWLNPDPALGVFLEIAPGLGFAPKVFGMFQGGLGIRYYF